MTPRLGLEATPNSSSTQTEHGSLDRVPNTGTPVLAKALHLRKGTV